MIVEIRTADTKKRSPVKSLCRVQSRLSLTTVRLEVRVTVMFCDHVVTLASHDTCVMCQSSQVHGFDHPVLYCQDRMPLTRWMVVYMKDEFGTIPNLSIIIH